MASMEKCNLDELLEALSEMDQAAIQQEKLNMKLQAEVHAQACELGRLQAEISAAALATPRAPSPPAQMPAPPVQVAGKMRWTLLWTAGFCLFFCLLLVMSNFFQAALGHGSLQHLVRKTPLQRILAPSPSFRLSASASQTSSTEGHSVQAERSQGIGKVQKASGSNFRQEVQHLSTSREGNASSGDELAMITPAPSKSVKQAGSDTNAGTSVREQLEDKSELTQGDSHGDKEAQTSAEVDETSRQEEKQPAPKKQAEVDTASAREQASAEDQGEKEVRTSAEVDETSRQEEKQPEPKEQAEVDTDTASAREQASAEDQVAKEVRTSAEVDETSRQEEKQPEPKKQAEVDTASANEQASAVARGDKEAQTNTQADETSKQEEKQPEPKEQAEVDTASAREQASAEDKGEKEVRTSAEVDETSRQEEKQPEPKKQAKVETASPSAQPSAEDQGEKEVRTSSEVDETSKQEEKQPEPKKQAEVDTASAREQASAEAQGDKEALTSTQADETSRQEEKQPEPKKQAKVDTASASAQPAAEDQGEKEVRTSAEADETSKQEEKQPEPKKQGDIVPASASEQASAEAQGDREARTSTEAHASRFGEAPSESKGLHEMLSEIDGFIPACDKFAGLMWKKDGHCGNATPWPRDLCNAFLGGSRTTPECGEVSEDFGTMEPPWHWSFASLLAISEKVWEAEETVERGLGGAIGLLAGAWCFW